MQPSGCPSHLRWLNSVYDIGWRWSGVNMLTGPVEAEAAAICKALRLMFEAA